MGNFVSDVVEIGSFGLIDDPFGIDAAQDAANQSAAGQERAQQLQYDMYMQNREDLSPYRQVATGPNGALQRLDRYGESKILEGDYIPASQMPAYRDYVSNIDLNQDPGFRFRMQEQENAINRSAAGMGKIMSGNRIEEIMKRSGDLASQEYQAAYGRATDLYSQDAAREQATYGRGVGSYERAYAKEADYLNHLRNLAQTGQTATTQTGQAGMNYAAQAGQNIIGAADARAAGTLAESQANQQILNMGMQAAGMYMGMPPMGGGAAPAGAYGPMEGGYAGYTPQPFRY